MLNKKGLMSRYQQSYQTKESNNIPRVGIWDFNKLSHEVEFFKPEDGRNTINIIPFKIKNKNHPLVKRGILNIGDMDYVMDVFVHKNVGAGGATVVCLKQTYGKPCPICEFRAKLKKEGRDKEADAFKFSRRAIYNVQDIKNPEKLKLFDVSHYLFEKELIDEASDGENGENFVDFADIENGKQINFKSVKVSKGGFEFNEYKSFSFRDREKPLNDSIINEAISLDDILNVLSYEEIEKLLFNKVDEEDEEFYEERPIDEVKEESKPKAEAKPATKTQCPYNHKYGVDCEKHEDCDNCECWDACSYESVKS